jgi:hypothetical protein
MKLSLVFVIAFVVGTAPTGVVASAQTADRGSSAFAFIAHSWIGKWTCTETQTGEPTERWEETMSLYGDKWIKSTGTYPADQFGPATSFESVLGYDTDRHQWVTVTFLASGSYGIDRSSSPASALTQTWFNAYPIDPDSNIPVTFAMSKLKWMVDGHYKEHGKKMSFHWDCIKIVGAK